MKGNESHEDDARTDGEVGEVTLDRLDVVARDVTERGPEGDPQGRAQRVEQHEACPVHPGDAGDDAVELAQTFDEARDHDDLAAVPIEELLRAVQPLAGEEHPLAVALDQLATTEPADRITHVVAGHSSEERDDPDEEDVEV